MLSALCAALEGDSKYAREITRFRGPCAFLSNMFAAPCTYEGDVYPTVEHAFQAAKTAPAERAEFRVAGLDAKAAKELGRKKPLLHGCGWWESTKLDIMETCVRSKFSTPELAALLVGTGDRTLLEGNTWGDTYWGVCAKGSSFEGENNLGKILMKLRVELRAAARAEPWPTGLTPEQKQRMESNRAAALAKLHGATNVPPSGSTGEDSTVVLLGAPPNLRERRGNLLDATEDWIVHQCNAVSSKLGGGGLSEQIFRKWPHANVYERFHARGSQSQPGDALLHGNGLDGSSARGVVNLIGQRYPGPPKHSNDSKAMRKEWFALALRALAAEPAISTRKSSVAFPCEIGCGLAGGDWAVYRSLIETFARTNPEVQVAIVRFGGGVTPVAKRARH
jgi:hypothetical protein